MSFVDEEDEDFEGEDTETDDVTSGSAEYDALITSLKQVRSGAKKAVVSLVTSFLESHPEVAALRWSQYTPSFNDGDPCTFTMNDIELSLKPEETDATDTSDEESQGEGADEEEQDEDDEDYEDEDEDEDDEDEDYGDFVSHYRLRDERPTLSEALARLNRAVDYDIFESAFGDGVEVTATREGFNISEYDCGY
jgi:hypothetical protein